MEIYLKHVGGSGNTPSSIVKILIESQDTLICEHLTCTNGYVDKEFIRGLRDVADQLEEQNRLVDKKFYEEQL